MTKQKTSNRRIFFLLLLALLAAEFILAGISETVVEVGEDFELQPNESFFIAAALLLLAMLLFAGPEGLSRIRRKMV